ncbi:tetratricopeptide repeat protein [Phnomibacter ginsenosidimutans]|uniref:Tetratricopeptide repeat protein n=1 Tax=Phnomibacter ginsenosidimutans TaxID=2676868 RepID=A0A6I6GPG2_9BACT|nr:tetratricopeptide repeat protein [Phnomibacter ginsenosidimutans]QGW26979.1 hypothetical protein GLV81_01660 [Phnomibacter ginsenosidimutans]
MGIQDNYATKDTFSLIIQYINKSELDSALYFLKKFPMDTLTYSVYSGIEPENRKDLKMNYLVYRYEEALQNLPASFLSSLQVVGYEDENSPVNLHYIEFLYLRNLEKPSKQLALTIIDSSNATLNAVKGEPLRLEFIKANAYETLGEYEKAINTYESLLAFNYYPYQSIRALIRICTMQKQLTKAASFIQLYGKRYPNEPLIERISFRSAEDSIIREIKKAESCNRQRDYIKGMAYLAQHWLFTKQYAKLDEFLDYYFENLNTQLRADETVLYQRGVCYDLKMKRLFIQKRYNEVCEFALLKLTENSVVQIASEKEFKEYVRAIYKEYSGKSPAEFEAFFASNFKKCI